MRGRQTMGLRAGQASAPLRGLAMGLAGERTRHPATPSPCCRLALDQQAARRGRSGLAAVCYIYCSGLQRPGPARPPLPWRPRLYFRIVEEIGAFPARCPPGVSRVPTTACPWRAPACRPCARPASGRTGGGSRGRKRRVARVRLPRPARNPRRWMAGRQPSVHRLRAIRGLGLGHVQGVRSDSRGSRRSLCVSNGAGRLRAD